jgi:ABC-2 type transport system ATP-binding protein
MINVKNLTKDYGSRRAINEITFEAHKGEVVGFLGPNGAGKTTAMRILTGYMPPTSGKAEIGGYDIIEDSLKARSIIGYLPETVPVYPEMSVYDYLAYFGKLRKVKNIDERLEVVLNQVGLMDRSESYVGNLSKGLRQRLGLAQALIHDPKVLILDEPTIGLDPAQILEVRTLIRKIHSEKTILLSTHILSEAQQLCDRVLIINKGEIVAEDTTDSLQAKLTGAQRVRVRIRGEIDDLKPVLAKINGVTNIIQKSDSSVEIECRPGADLRPEIAKAAIQSGFDLLELQQDQLSLEDIFLRLTRDQVPKPSFRETPVSKKNKKG